MLFERRRSSVRCHTEAAPLVVAIAVGILALGLGASLALADDKPCRSVEHEGSTYTVCAVDLRRHFVKLFWKAPEGEPYNYLSALPRQITAPGGRLLFATNAGMFDVKYRPIGLYVENGRELVRAVQP